MAHNLTGAGTVTYTASIGAFGQRLASGSGSCTQIVPSSGPFTVEGRCLTVQTGAIGVAVGSVNTFWVGKGTGNTLQLHFGAGGTEITIDSGVNVTDGVVHSWEWDYDPATGSKFFVDGNLVGTNASTAATVGATFANVFEVATFGGSFPWFGNSDEIAVWTMVLHTTSYTPRTVPIVDTSSGLVALYHFEGNLNDSATTGINVSVTGAGMVLSAGSVGIPQNPQLAGVAMTMGVGSVSPTVNAFNVAQMVFSPYNWNIVGNNAKTINAGAWFKTIFSGTSCALQFDMTGILTPLPEISYRVDGYGPWYTANIASSVPITIPTDTTDYANKPGHFLEVYVKATTESVSVNNWTSQQGAVSLIGILLDSGSGLIRPPERPKALHPGDSITQGVRTVNNTATNDVDRADAYLSFSMLCGQLLGVDVGNVGFGGTGYNTGGSVGVPSILTSWNQIYAGVSRSFSTAPVYVCVELGQNDGGSITANCTTTLNNYLGVIPAGTPIFVMDPFTNSHASEIQSAIAACNNPSQCFYVNTGGWFNTSYSSDGLHPYGIENIYSIAPKLADFIRPYISSALIRPTATKTVTKTFQTPGGVLQANLTGLDWEWQDVRGITIDKGTGATTNSSGVFSITVHTNLAPGGVGYLKVTNTTGSINTTYISFYGPVAVS